MQAIGTSASMLAILIATTISSVVQNSMSHIVEVTHGTATGADHGITDVTSVLATTATSAECAMDGTEANTADMAVAQEITTMAHVAISVLTVATVVTDSLAAPVAEALPTAVPPATSQDVVSEAVMKA